MEKGRTHMRKKKIRLLALLLAFSMVLSVIPMPVLAEGTETHVHNDSGTAVTFTTAWTSNNSLPASAGSYYLTEDVSISGTWTVPTGTTTNLDLNGHSIIMTGAQTVIKVSGSSTVFNLYDCQGTGKITGGRGNSSTSRSSAGGVAVKGSSIFNMYGGNISGNDAGANGFGGGI